MNPGISFTTRRGLALSGVIVAVFMGQPSLVAAQDPPPPPGNAEVVREPGSLSSALGLSVPELVAELPGRPVALGELRRIARERSLPLEASRVARELADAGVGVLSGDFDLGLAFSAEVARSRLLDGRSGSYGAALEQLLPWGTALGVGLTGSRTPGAGGLGSAYDADVGVSLSQPILEGFGSRDAQLRAARRVRQAAVHRLARATETVLADVEFVYWDLAEAEATEAVLARSYELAEALLSRNAQLAERGLLAEVDVLTARGGVALRRSLLVSATRDRADAADALLFLVWGEGAAQEIARDPTPLKTATSPPEAPDVGSVGEAQARALEQRWDVAAAVADMEGTDVLADAAENGLLPSLSLDGSLQSGGTEGSLGRSLGSIDRGWSWGVGLRFSQPLGNRRDRGLHREADLARVLRRLDVVSVENQVRLEVRSAVRAIDAGVERFASAEEASELAQAQLEAERQRLDLGLGDSFRLLETEENAAQASLEAVRARYDLARAVTAYRLAVGGVSPE